MKILLNTNLKINTLLMSCYLQKCFLVLVLMWSIRELAYFVQMLYDLFVRQVIVLF